MTQTPDEAALALCAEVEALDKAATAGAWVVPPDDKKWDNRDSDLVSEVHQAALIDERKGCIIGCEYNYSATFGGLLSANEGDAAFIAHTRASAPALAAHVRRLTQERKEWLGRPCQCNPVGSGEEYCNGACYMAERAEAAEAEVKRLNGVLLETAGPLQALIEHRDIEQATQALVGLLRAALAPAPEEKP